jgi:AGCS family alanine or glycine:cation symporter
VIAVLLGSILSPATIINFSDAANGLMAAPNLVCLVLLSGVIASETRVHRRELTGRD